MSLAKVIEVVARSDKSWEDAIQNAVSLMAQKGKDVKSVFVKDMQAKVENNKISSYKVNLKITCIGGERHSQPSPHTAP